MEPKKIKRVAKQPKKNQDQETLEGAQITMRLTESLELGDA